MIKVIFCDGFGKSKIVSLPYVPAVGQKVSWYYKPWPIVDSVLLVPEKEDKEAIKREIGQECDVLITVG